MYPCSNAFHQAVANGEPQIAMLVFADGIFTNSDLDVSSGIDFSDFFCTGSNIGIGEAVSNTISFRLFNDHQLLNTFPFGRFRALLGARISSSENASGLSLTYNGHVFVGSAYQGRRLTKDGSPTYGQPSFTVTGLAAMDGVVYCFGANGEIYAVSAGTGRAADYPNNAFMHYKAKRFYGLACSYENKILTINEVDGPSEVYEFVPLGTFIAERPNVVTDREIDMTCNDLMQLFDKDMSSVTVNYGSTGISLRQLLSTICQSEQISLQTTSFINSNIVVTEAPEEFESCSARDVIAWIAEAAGSNAKMTRDGKLALVWLSNTSQSFDENSYTECRPYFYQTSAVNKLCVRDLTSGTDTIQGSGGNAYLIQDNPFLRG